jgi:hypothetical protein
VSTDLDIRLRAAGTSLRAAVEDIEPRPLPSPGPVRRPLLAAAALLVVVAAIAAAVALARDEPDSNVSTDPDEVPRLVLDESVVDLPATGAVELPPPDDSAGALITVRVFEGPRPGGGTAEIGVLTFQSDGDAEMSWEPGEGSEPVTVQGHAARYRDDPSYGPAVAWVPTPDRIVTVASRQLDRDQVLAVAEATVVTDDDVVPGPVGPGLAAPEPVGRPGHLDVLSVTPVPAGAVGHAVGYQSDEEPDRLLFLTVVAGDDSDMRALRWMAAADTPVEVRGGPGWIGSRVYDAARGSASHTVVWEESPGVVASLSASGFTADEVLHLAQEGVVTAPDAEWAALVDASQQAAPVGEEAAVGSSDGDTSWSVYLEDGVVCAAVQAASSGSESCGSVPGGAEILEDDAGNQLAVYGAYPEGAVGVRNGDGSPLGAMTAPSEDGVIVYAIGLDGGPPPTEVVFVDADGNEVGRIQVGFAPAVEAESPAPPGP